MKTKKKLILTALTACCVGTLTAGVSVMAFANTDTAGHEFTSKFDGVWYNFATAADANDLEITSPATAGEKPYLSVEYTSGSATSLNSSIYKQGTPSGEHGAYNLVLEMRAPDGDVDLSELKLALRYNDDSIYEDISFSALRDGDGSSFSSIGTEWTKYVINFANSFDDDVMFPGVSVAVNSGNILGFHVYAAAEAEGTLEINSVYYTSDNEDATESARTMLNNFTGGTTVTETASAVNEGTWWADSVGGKIVSRKVSVSGNGSVAVIGDTVGETLAAYEEKLYAVIEAEGTDFSGFKVDTTTDGTTWTEATDFDADTMSVAVSEDVKGFKFTNSSQSAVTLKRIYLTNLYYGTPATAVPVIDASTADLLEDFSYSESNFMSSLTFPWTNHPAGYSDAGIDFRVSDGGSEYVKIEDGNLVFDNSANAEYINFKFQMLEAANGSFLVMKVKLTDGATLNDFRFQLGADSESLPANIFTYANQLQAGLDFSTPLLTDDNLYREGDWYYLVADIAQSGFDVSATGYKCMNLYYSGEGKMYIDSIFFADELVSYVDVYANTVAYVKEWTPAADANGYTYVDGVDLPAGTYSKIGFTLTPGSDFDVTEFRVALANGGNSVITLWVAQLNGAITADGKKLSEVDFTSGTPVELLLDLAVDGEYYEVNTLHIHSTGTATGSFKIENIQLYSPVKLSEYKDFVATGNVVTVSNEDGNVEFNAAPTTEGYTYIGGASFDSGLYGKIEFTLTPGANFNGKEFRFELANGSNSVITIWVAQLNGAITVDGKKYSEITFTEGVPVTLVFDTTVTQEMNMIHIHSSGTATGAFTVSDIKLTEYQLVVSQKTAQAYAAQVALLPKYLDNVKPTVSITTATTAKAGDTVAVTYTASDDVTADSDLNVTISVVKDGNAVTLTADNKFTAAEGVYTVTVTVRDENGNEESDTIQITVTAASTSGDNTPGNTPADNGDKEDDTNLTWLWVLIAVVAVVAVGVGVYFIIKKTKKSN